MRGKPIRPLSSSAVQGGSWGAVQHSSSQIWPGILTFSYNPDSNSVTNSSANALEVLGVSQQHLSVHGALFLAYVHPADRFTIETLLDTALRDGTPYIATYRWIRPDTNEVRFIHCRAENNPESGLFEGVMIDLTSEAPKMRGEGDLTLAIGDLLHHFGLPGITLDIDFTIRAVVPGLDDSQISLGIPDIDHAALRPGVSLLDCFTSTTSKQYVHALIDKALLVRSENVELVTAGRRTFIRPLLSENVPQGVVIFSIDGRAEEEAILQASALQRELEKLELVRSCRPAIASAAQEIAGYGALITRHARGNPLLAAISDSLFQSIRELAQTTDMLGSTETTRTPHPLSDPFAPRERKAPALPTSGPAPHIIFASNSHRSATSHALYLRGAGFACATSTLEEGVLNSLLQLVSKIQVIIIDAPALEGGITALVRRLRRSHPHIHTVCLVSAESLGHAEVLRAGAVAVIAKPAPLHEIERVLRALVSLPFAQILT